MLIPVEMSLISSGCNLECFKQISEIILDREVKCSLLVMLYTATHENMKKQDSPTALKKKKNLSSLCNKFCSRVDGYKCSCIVTKTIILPHYSSKSPQPSVKNTFEEM